jgi:hypothetical protein
VYSANAECDPATGQTTVSWLLTNNGATPVPIMTTFGPVPMNPNPVPAFGSASATLTVDGPDTDQQVTTTATVDGGAAGQIQLSDDITVAACQGPEFPPEVTFTFTTTPSVSRAAVGDTVEYTYCGQNTSTIPLEIVRLVDDRLGVLIELPSVQTIIGPGESLCNTDLAIIVSYVVQADDAGGVIHNNAVVTVRTQEAEPRQFQATATSEVAVSLAAAEQQGQKDIRICHRTNSHDTPYNPQTHNESTLTSGGHASHTGPIWFPGITVDWGDIIEPFTQSDGTQNPGYNWPEGAAILNNDCETRAPQSPTTSTTSSTTTTPTTSTSVPDTSSTTATTSTSVLDTSSTSATSTSLPDTSSTSSSEPDSTTSTSTSTSEPGSTTSLTPPPPGISFTFANDPSVPTAEVGDTVEYSYCGQNTSEVDLEVVRVVDDRYGTLEVPEEQTTLSPGETLCNTDLDLPVTYVARPADAGTTIVNNAVVTVRTLGAEPQEFQAADPAEVEIVAAGGLGEPTTTALPATSTTSTSLPEDSSFTSPSTTSTVPGSTTSLTPPPPGISFTFTNDPSVPAAEVGDTVEYSYCGENTSEVDLEVVRVVDDRFGTLEVPEEQTTLSPGETLCNTDLGLPVTYVARPADAGTTIVNNAVVTVRTVGAQAQAFQTADPAEVDIVAAGEQVEPTTTALPPTGLANTGASSIPLGLVVSAGMVASGWLVVIAARRRRTESDGSIV